jgi:HSP20 family protein
MPGLIIWKNQRFDKLRKDMDRMFDRMRGEFGMSVFPRIGREFPTIDLAEAEDSLVVSVEVSDMDPENIDIDVTENRLRITGRIKHNLVCGKEGFLRTERRHSFFSRTLQLPCGVVADEVKTVYKDGFLRIILPKYKPEKTMPGQIET